MEHPPPVPPKDPQYCTRMEIDHTPYERPSSSKRKREAHDNNIDDLYDGSLDPDAFTPKRSRSHPQQSEDTSDDATPMQQRNIRRKKGVRNLSNLNLRHAAERQDHAEAQRIASKESKFVEGSLTDKPSEKPPSAYTRLIQSESGNLQYVDELMADYHDGMPTPPHGSAEIAIAQEKAEIPKRVAAISAQHEHTGENKGFLFRFGRQLAASFHPVKMWKQVWDETADDLRQKNLVDMEKQRMSKEEAERRYAEMKSAGQFMPKHVQHVSAGENTITPRDSGVAMSSARPTIELTRPMTNEPRTSAENEANDSPEDIEPPETGHKVLRSIRSRLNFKRSISNLKIDLKRPKSDFNLAAAARESSSSVSPIKTDAEASALKQSASKIDLKKQYKLSKRVSNLETKLQHARMELDHALVQASPAPKLGKKYERFQSPHSTLKRPKFAMSSKLPSLPSERLLDPMAMGFAPEELESNEAERERARAHADAMSALEGTRSDARGAIDLSTGGEEFDVTIKSFRSTPYPTRADSLFRLDKNSTIGTNIDQPEPNTTAGADDPNLDEDQHDDMDITDNINVAMEPTTPFVLKETEAEQPKTYATLDAKLKALDASAKAARKPSKTKKRKSGDDEKLFKPTAGDDDDDDSDWEQGGSKSKTKKRKSTGSKAEKKSSPQAAKKGKKAPITQKASPLGKKASNVFAANDPIVLSDDEMEQDEPSKLANTQHDIHAPVRTSMDSQSLASLEPVYEEDEDVAVATTTAHVPLNAEPAQPTARATPARHSRARSASPVKRPRSPSSEEQLLTRAAEAAQRTRTVPFTDTAASPPPGAKAVRVNVGEANESDIITVVPGENGAPELPKGANGSFESLVQNGGKNVVLENENVDTSPRKGRGKVKKGKSAVGPTEGFEWPEDVF